MTKNRRPRKYPLSINRIITNRWNVWLFQKNVS
nr:hypothetical protein [Listeria monocytogenes]